MGWVGAVRRCGFPGLGVIGASDVGAATSITLQGPARQPPQLIAQVTVAYLPSKVIDEDAGLVDQSRLPSSLLSTII